MRKSLFFFKALAVVLFFIFSSTNQLHAQSAQQPTKGIHTYTLVISGMQSAQDAKLLNDDLLKISGVLSSTTNHTTGQIVVTAKKGVLPEHLKKVIVAHNGDIKSLSDKFE